MSERFVLNLHAQALWRALIALDAPDVVLYERFPQHWQAYLAWLLEQEEIPSSYRAHPFTDESALMACKQALESALGLSLGALIRGLRINRLLRSRPHSATALACASIDTPLGVMLALFSEKGLCLLEFADRKMLPNELQALLAHYPQHGMVQAQAQAQVLQQQLTEYFAGTRQRFEIALDEVGTAFQKRIWQILQEIPYGETLSYKTQAQRYGNLSAVRAVANANGQNRISIIIPCHRVIGSDGSLTGYGGGLPRKRYLLNLENKTLS